jgi:uncharacterized protein (DUF1501 family)
MMSTGLAVPQFLAHTAYGAELQDAAAAANERILVVIQFSGGNDGLNTVIPLNESAYYTARSSLAIPSQNVLAIDGVLGLHPGLRPFKELLDKGVAAVINGVGYPNPNRSHFRSMDIWHTAQPEIYGKDGWLGRYGDAHLAALPSSAPAVYIGVDLPLALRGRRLDVAAIDSIPNFQFQTDSRLSASRQLVLDRYEILHRDAAQDPTQQFIQSVSLDALVTSRDLQRLAASYTPAVTYPSTSLGNALRAVAQILSSSLGTRIFYTQIGGFDTHANQGAATGAHNNLLTAFAGAVSAFYQDLEAKGLADRVLIMTFSEFGRRVSQNGSGGTDHGTLGPMFMIGRQVRGGLYGKYPSLTNLEQGDFKYTADATDFRRVYATVLKRWLEVDPTPILGSDFAPLDFLP